LPAETVLAKDGRQWRTSFGTFGAVGSCFVNKLFFNWLFNGSGEACFSTPGSVQLMDTFN
jgi:hypothetical protein